jgi:predicted metal-dependent RNase
MEVMTAIEMNAELLRNMSIIAEDENLLKRAAKYLRKLVAEKEDPTLMTKEEFFARIDKAEKEISEGKGITFTNKDDMNAWLKSL